jgi:hypothetical protein
MTVNVPRSVVCPGAFLLVNQLADTKQCAILLQAQRLLLTDVKTP